MLALGAGQAEQAPVWFRCQPEAVEGTLDGERFAATCRDGVPGCGWWSIIPADLEQIGEDRLQRSSSTDDGTTVTTETRLLADGRFEQNVRWTNAQGGVLAERRERGRCTAALTEAERDPGR